MGDDLKISLLTIGDSQVGKSSLLLRFASDNGKYNAQSMPTIGIDFKMKNIDLDGTRIKLQIVRYLSYNPFVSLCLLIRFAFSHAITHFYIIYITITIIVVGHSRSRAI